jgi:transposase
LYIAPWIYNCNCNTEVFNIWLEKVFIPEIKLIKKTYPGKPITLIMDNVAYHKSEKTQNILEKNEINLKFQPTYSPDLTGFSEIY